MKVVFTNKLDGEAYARHAGANNEDIGIHRHND